MVEPSDVAEHHPDAIVGYGYEPGVLARAGIERAAGFVAGTDNDTTNLSLIAAARRANPTLFVAARQNKAASAPLFAAVEVDSMLVPADVVAHEVYAAVHAADVAVPAGGAPARRLWAAAVVGRLTELCGEHLQAVWKVRLTATEAPGAVARRGRGAPGDLLRNPDDRDEPLHAVPLLLARAAGVTTALTSRSPRTTTSCWLRRRAAARRLAVRASPA